VDLIVMATHGRTGLARLVVGSVALGVLQQANVPVLLVRPAAMQHAERPPSRAIQHLETGQLSGRSEPAIAR
jgi:hypothetical protein